MIFIALLIKYSIKNENRSKSAEEVRVCAEVTHFEKTGVSAAYLHNKEKFQ
jgi:hypothetical protein